MVFFLKYLLNLADVPSGHELSSYYTRDDDRGALRGMRDTDSLGASYDRYLRSAVLGLLFFIFRPQFQCSVIYMCWSNESKHMSSKFHLTVGDSLLDT